MAIVSGIGSSVAASCHYSPHSSFTFPSTSLKSLPTFRSLHVSVSVSDADTAAGSGFFEKQLSDEALDAENSRDWDAARSYNDSGLIYEGRVLSGNVGGLMITFFSLVGFLPYSQLSPSHLCKEPNKPLLALAKSLAGSPIYVKFQEILMSTNLDQEGIKRALQRVLERVP